MKLVISKDAKKADEVPAFPTASEKFEGRYAARWALASNTLPSIPTQTPYDSDETIHLKLEYLRGFDSGMKHVRESKGNLGITCFFKEPQNAHERAQREGFSAALSEGRELESRTRSEVFQQMRKDLGVQRGEPSTESR